MSIKRAISIRQPFVELILQEKKKYEYRSTLTNIRERVYIYASLTPSDHGASWKKVKKKPGELVTGLIVGSVEIVDCMWDDKIGEYAYKLSNPKRILKHLKAKNHPTPKFWIPKF
ncbi:MAG: ASCH domain-containing protein [Cyclobacteriaceae bacterium]|nr:ASCH domain-containing protein [Cyclobacteriaceae bacterium]